MLGNTRAKDFRGGDMTEVNLEKYLYNTRLPQKIDVEIP